MNNTGQDSPPSRAELLSLSDRRERDLLWAVSLPSLVFPAFSAFSAPPDDPGRRAVRLVSDPRHWMEDEFFHALTDTVRRRPGSPWAQAARLPRRSENERAPSAWRIPPSASAGTARFRQRVQNDRAPSAWRIPPSASAGTVTLPRVGEKRHGLVYEDLLTVAMNADPSVVLLAHDVSVVADRRTVGQADFLFRRRECVYHLETAVKFYLRLGHRDRLDRMVGTNLSDRMDRKLAHMLFHQRTLLASAMGRKTLEQRGLPEPDRSAVALRGLFFEPLREMDPEEPGRTWWATWDEWRNHPFFAGLAWAEVPRTCWFSPMREEEARWVPADDVELDLSGGPVAVAGLGYVAGEGRLAPSTSGGGSGRASGHANVLDATAVSDREGVASREPVSGGATSEWERVAPLRGEITRGFIVRNGF